MSTPSPLQPQPQGALEQASSPKSRVRITVLTILALHVVVIGGLLLQGCDKRPTRTSPSTNTVGSLPPINDSSNFFSSFPGDPVGGAGAVAPGRGALGAGSGSLSGAPDAGAGTHSLGAGSGLGAASGQGSALSPAGGASNPSVPPANLSNASSLPPVVTLPPANPSGAVQGTEHAIKAGDTIGGLATKYHVTAKAILDANPNIKPKNLRIDEKVTIPAPVAASTPATGGAAGGTAGGEVPAAGAGAAASASGDVYIVKQGDTLAKIAGKFGVSVKHLRAVNKLKGDRITAKQKLTIPAKTPAAPSAAAPSKPAGQI